MATTPKGYGIKGKTGNEANTYNKQYMIWSEMHRASEITGDKPSGLISCQEGFLEKQMFNQGVE